MRHEVPVCILAPIKCDEPAVQKQKSKNSNNKKDQLFLFFIFAESRFLLPIATYTGIQEYSPGKSITLLGVNPFSPSNITGEQCASEGNPFGYRSRQHPFAFSFESFSQED